MTRHCLPVPARRQPSLPSLVAVLALALGLAGCLEPVSTPKFSVDAGDASVIFVPDTVTPPKDVFLAELSGPDASDDTADVMPPPDADDTADDTADATADDASDASDVDDATDPADGDGQADAGDATDSDTALPDDATEAADASPDTDLDASTDASAADAAEDTTAVDGGLTDALEGDAGALDAADLADAATSDADATTGDDAALPDAGTPVACGDTLCDAAETCATCPADCGPCPEVCGDASCTASESCETCPADCGICPGPVCEVLTSVGCLPGEQCFPDGNLNLCWSAGTAKYGEPCGALDCELGSLCVGGVCRTLCSTDLNPLLPGCLSGVPCQTLVGPGGPLGPNLGACQTIANCDPWTHSGCPTGHMCVVEGDFKACAQPGAQGPGSACQTSWVCAKGLVCVEGAKGVDPAVAGTCRPACDVTAPVCASGSCWPTLGPDAAANPYGLGGCVP